MPDSEDAEDALDYGEEQICEPCKKKRGARKLVERLSPDELSMEQERRKDQIEDVKKLQQIKHVPEEQQKRMNALRWDEGLTLKDIVSQIFVEYGDEWSVFTVEYQTNPVVRAKILKSGKERYEIEGQQGISEQAKEYAAAKQLLFQQLRSVGYNEAEIRALFEMQEFKSKGKLAKVESTFLEMTPQTLGMVRDAKESGNPALINRRLAETQMSVNDVMIVKRQLEEAGMNDIAKEISMPLIKRIKKEERYATDMGGWDRIWEDEDW